MPHFIPYLILIVVTAAWMIYVTTGGRRPEAVVIVLVFSGMIFIFEFVVLLLLGAYEYIPDIIRIRYYDNVMGALVSNLIAVPAAAAAIALYRLRLPQIAAFIVLFAGIEELFVALGVYKHYWWRTIYTAVSMLIFFYLTKRWLAALTSGHRVVRFVSLLMFAWCVSALANYVSALAGLRAFHIGLFANQYRDDLFISDIYAFLVAAVVTAAAYLPDWRRRFAVLVLLLAIPASFMAAGTLRPYIPAGLYLLFSWLVYAALLWLTAGVRRVLLRIERA